MNVDLRSRPAPASMQPRWWREQHYALTARQFHSFPRERRLASGVDRRAMRYEATPEPGFSPSGGAGFAMLEVIVAFIILSLALGVLYQAASVALHSARTTSRYEQALSRARSRLVIAGHGRPLAAGEWRGDDGGGFSWRLRVVQIGTTSVRSFGSSAFRQPQSIPVTLYAVSVFVTWRDLGEERSVRLDTEQVGQNSQ